MSHDLNAARRNRTGLLAFGLVGTAFLVATLGVGACVLAGDGKPRADKEGKDWTHKELLEYLNGKGLDLTMDTADLGTGRKGAVSVGFFGRIRGGNERGLSVTVHRYPTAEQAREQAGATESGYAWGRFYFAPASKSGVLERVKAALGD